MFSLSDAASGNPKVPYGAFYACGPCASINMTIERPALSGAGRRLLYIMLFTALLSYLSFNYLVDFWLRGLSQPPYSDRLPQFLLLQRFWQGLNWMYIYDTKGQRGAAGPSAVRHPMGCWQPMVIAQWTDIRVSSPHMKSCQPLLLHCIQPV